VYEGFSKSFYLELSGLFNGLKSLFNSSGITFIIYSKKIVMKL
jgi:hypothetical protein